MAHGKPAPDVFLLAAARIGVDPTRCAVVEDGIAGMRAARQAGMHCVALIANIRRQVPADVGVSTLRELLQHPELLVPGRRTVAL